MIYDVSANEQTTRSLKFQNQALPITQKPNKINASQKKPDELTIRELREQIKLLDQNSVNTNKMKVEMYNRFALPLASLVCAIVGAPLGMQKQRGSSSIGFGISVVYLLFHHDPGQRPGQWRQDTGLPRRLPAGHHLWRRRRHLSLQKIEMREKALSHEGSAFFVCKNIVAL